MSTTPDTIGLLGGTGPAATAHLHSLLIAGAQRRGAAADHDFPGLVITSAALPGTNALGFDEDQAPALTAAYGAALDFLAEAGAAIIVPACNTLDALAPAPAGVSVLSLPTLAAEEARRRGACVVGVLSSRGAARRGIHARAQAALGIDTLTADPTVQTDVDFAIAAGMAGGLRSEAQQALDRAADVLRRAGADIVIAGCTELSMLDTSGLLDPADLAAERALDLSYQGARACA